MGDEKALRGPVKDKMRRGPVKDKAVDCPQGSHQQCADGTLHSKDGATDG